ncbi:MAG: hypothetical protein ABI380_00265 [Edaphobacter sp.]
MKPALRNLAAVLCLLMVFISSASCMDIASHSQASSCKDCSRHTPLHQQTPECCNAHQQPSVTATVATINQPAQASPIESPVASLNTVTILPLQTQLTSPPPLPPLIKLRI